jgi:hypothetical protein
MKNNPAIKTKYLGLVGSLVIWLCCAWAGRQPVSIQNAQPTPISLKPVTTQSDSLKRDPESGLVIDETMPIVKGQCTACHSSKLILQSHFDRDKWIERIRWMQRTQKLWDLGETEKPILDYLTKYYGAVPIPFDGRRFPLPSQTWHKS